MAYLSPCGACPLKREPCETRETMRAKIRGLGLTSARFVCARIKDELRPGRRVQALIRGATWGQYDDDGYADIKVPATVMGPSGKQDRWLVWPDDEAHDRLPGVSAHRKLCALRGEYLKPLDEPDRPERLAELAELDRMTGEVDMGAF